MQIAPEEGAFLAFLVELIGARRCIEIGTFTGYSSIAIARALPEDGNLVCCDVSEEWTSVARKYWDVAGVADKIDLRLRPALETLDQLLADGGKRPLISHSSMPTRQATTGINERLLLLVRPGGLIAFDNTLRAGAVLDQNAEDEDTRALQALNVKLAGDERISLCLLPVADGVMLARRR